MGAMTPAERLRAAAEKIRETAKAFAAQEGSVMDFPLAAIPTLDPDNNGWVVYYDYPDADWDTTIAQTPYDYTGEGARHIALWSPPVALAVADLLDAQARYVDDVAMMFGEADHETDAGALALADLILGAES